MTDSDIATAQEQLIERRQANGRKPKTVAEIATEMANGRKAELPLPPPEPVEVVPGQVVRLNTLDTSWHPMVAEAVEMARAWQKERQAGRRNASMVLVASQVKRPDGTPDIERTGYGCGKTHIAMACLWSECLASDGVPVAPVGKFFTADRLIQAMDAGTLPRDELGDAPIIVIDDVGAEQQIPFAGNEQRQELERWARYFKVIDYCADTKDDKPGVAVIITGNLTLDKLAERVGGRAWSRLLEMAPAGFMLDMTGVKDHRRKAGGR